MSEENEVSLTMALGSQNNSAAWIRLPVLGILGVWALRGSRSWRGAGRALGGGGVQLRDLEGPAGSGAEGGQDLQGHPGE